MALQKVIFKAKKLLYQAQCHLCNNDPGLAIKDLLSIQELIEVNANNLILLNHVGELFNQTVTGAYIMNLREIMTVVQGHTNAARSALNAGAENVCRARLADLSAFLISDGPAPVDDEPEQKEPDNG